MKKEKIIHSFKGFDEDMKCRGFQYEVGKSYKQDGPIKCCEKGFHACECPLDVWNYYSIITSRFAEVEQWGNINSKKDNYSIKLCSSNIKIEKELTLSEMIERGVDWIQNASAAKLNDKEGSVLEDSSANSGIIVSSGSFARIASYGDFAKIGSSGVRVQIASSGNYLVIGSSGNFAQIASSGDFATIGSCGDSAGIASCGDSVEIGSTGDSAAIVTSSEFAQIRSEGQNSVVMCAGDLSVAKAKKGSWITLAEWCWNEDKVHVPVCVKTERVDGVKIKEDTFYKLMNGEFVEVKDR